MAQRGDVKKTIHRLGRSLFLLAALGGCSTLQSVKSGADGVKGAADEAKSQKDSTTATVKDEMGKAKSGGGSGGAGSSAGATRLEASDAPVNTPISDKIDVKQGKQNDWRKFQLTGKHAYATFDLFWDDPDANLHIDVYNQFGVVIGRSPRPLGTQSHKQVLLPLDPGLYYVRISGPNRADSTIYTMEVTWHGAPAPDKAAADKAAADKAAADRAAADKAAADRAAADKAAAERSGKSSTTDSSSKAPFPPPLPPEPPAVPCPPGQECPTAPDPNKVYASIVNVIHEGGAVLLYLTLDKGADDRLRVGQRGTILQGAEGDKPLDGGAFALTRVVDGQRAIAKSVTLQRSVGRNKRVVIDVK